jgi:hypothetical protein
MNRRTVSAWDSSPAKQTAKVRLKAKQDVLS